MLITRVVILIVNETVTTCLITKILLPQNIMIHIINYIDKYNVVKIVTMWVNKLYYNISYYLLDL